MLSLLCAWARHFKTRTQRRQCCPLLKLLLIKKIYHLNTLHIYPAKTNKDSKTNKGRVTEFLYQALELRRPIVRFLQKTRAWSRSKSLWPITTLLQITNYTSPNYTDRPQMNIHCIEKFFTVHDFWATCACPEKNRVALKIFTVANNVLFAFRICNNFRLTCKQSFPWNFSLYWIYFLLFRIFQERRLPWKKQSCPEIFHCIEYTFFHSGFLSNLRLPWKTELPWNF